ncbi:MAG: hypothetical protein AB7E47_06030 [Desulfovibrionaceae bacterium]
MLRKLLNLFSRSDVTTNKQHPHPDVSTQNISSFATKADVITRAFYRVMDNITPLSAVDKEHMCAEFISTHQSGRPKASIDVCQKWLPEDTWGWPWFDEWMSIFQEQEQWPYMWKQLNLNSQEPVEPSSIEDAVSILTVAEMRTIYKTNTIKVNPAPKNRADFENAISTHCTIEHIAELTASRIKLLKEEYTKKMARSRIEILAHTLDKMAYTLRDEEQREKSGGLSHRGYKLTLSSSGCPVEDSIAQAELKKGKTPPFFPGDRSSLRWKKR